MLAPPQDPLLPAQRDPHHPPRSPVHTSDCFARSDLPFEFFCSELNTGEPQRQLQAISRMRVICLALGPEKTRKHLLTFLQGEMVSCRPRPRKPRRRTPATLTARHVLAHLRQRPFPRLRRPFSGQAPGRALPRAP